MNAKIILASTSPYRVAQLKAFGLKFTPRAPLVDEEKLKLTYRRLKPRALSRELALAKARSLGTDTSTVVIGADQLLHFRGRTLGKPKTVKGNIKMLSALQNKKHELITSVAVVHGHRHAIGTVTATIKMRQLSKREIRAYVRRDCALDCAGGYKFEKGGLSLVDKIVVSDPSSLVGLSLITLQKLFLKLKIPMVYL